MKWLKNDMVENKMPVDVQYSRQCRWEQEGVRQKTVCREDNLIWRYRSIRRSKQFYMAVFLCSMFDTLI